MYKVEIGGLVVHVETLEELREIVRNFSDTKTAVPASGPVTDQATLPGLGHEPQQTEEGPPVPKNVPRGARYAPTEVKIRSVSTEEAMLKLYKGLDNATHRDALRYLASRGEKGAGIEELKDALKLPEKYKFGGFTAAIRRRAPHYGLDPEQVVVVEYRGVVANVRILDYRLGPEMLETMVKHGLVWKPKAGKEGKAE